MLKEPEPRVEAETTVLKLPDSSMLIGLYVAPPMMEKE